MNNYMYLVPIAAVIALLFAAYLAGKVGKQDAIFLMLQQQINGILFMKKHRKNIISAHIFLKWENIFQVIIPKYLHTAEVCER